MLVCNTTTLDAHNNDPSAHSPPTRMSAAILLVALSVLLGVVDAVPTCPPHCHAGGANGVLRLPGCDGCLELRPDELEHAVVDATAAGVNVVPRLARPVENACGPSCARLPPHARVFAPECAACAPETEADARDVLVPRAALRERRPVEFVRGVSWFSGIVVPLADRPELIAHLLTADEYDDANDDADDAPPPEPRCPKWCAWLPKPEDWIAKCRRCRPRA